MFDAFGPGSTLCTGFKGIRVGTAALVSLAGVEGPLALAVCAWVLLCEPRTPRALLLTPQNQERTDASYQYECRVRVGGSCEQCPAGLIFCACVILSAFCLDFPLRLQALPSP